MLVLSREVNERIYVDGPCWVSVVAAKEGRARLGFEAALSVSIHREEVIGKPRHESREERKAVKRTEIEG